MKAIIRLEFPCGLKYFSLHEVSPFEVFSTIALRDDDAGYGICPMHGKNCKRQK